MPKCHTTKFPFSLIARGSWPSSEILKVEKHKIARISQIHSVTSALGEKRNWSHWDRSNFWYEQYFLTILKKEMFNKTPINSNTQCRLFLFNNVNAM